MRDSKLIFHGREAPTAASAVVDVNSSEPGVGDAAFYSATINGHTVSSDATVTISTSETATGTFVDCAEFIIPQARAAEGNVIISVPIPTTAKRFLKTNWVGLTGGLLTDGIDWGLKDGSAATKPFLA